jgi:hypothetical protein
LVANLAVVAILGAGIRIPQGALPYFAGKRIRVFQDDDISGRCAAARWANQLATPGVNVDGFSFTGFTQADGASVKDLNNFVRIDPDQWEAERDLIERTFDFVLERPPL